MEAKPYKIPHPFKKLNKKLIESLCKSIKKGSPVCYAAESLGITERIFYIWVQQGRIDIDLQEDTLPASLVQSLAKIHEDEIQWCRQSIKSNEKGHKGAEWTLEHAHWRQFGTSAPILQLAQEMEEFKAQLLKGKNDGQAKDEDKE